MDYQQTLVSMRKIVMNRIHVLLLSNVSNNESNSYRNVFNSIVSLSKETDLNQRINLGNLFAYSDYSNEDNPSLNNIQDKNDKEKHNLDLLLGIIDDLIKHPEKIKG